MIRLECTTGGSNKFYELHEQSAFGGRYTAYALYGKIGQAPTKSVIYDGVSPDVAKTALKKKMREKLAKGYSVVGNPVVKALGSVMKKLVTMTDPINGYNESPGSQYTGTYHPPIVNDIPIIWAMNAQGVKDDKHFNALMADDNYIAQEKLDGMRAVVHVTESGLRIFSRSAGVADPTRPLEKTTSLPHLANLRFPTLVGSVFDCEILAEGVDCANISGAIHTKDGGKSAGKVKLYVFDMLMDERGKSMMDMMLDQRLFLLDIAARVFVNENIIHIQFAKGSLGKSMLYDWVTTSGGEGIMLKNLNATYQQGGRPSKNWYKKKKHSTWDCVIMGFTKGEGKFTNKVGAIIFGQYVNGKLTKMGQTSGMIDYDRAHLTARGDDFIGKAIIVKGMERLKSGAIRHPQWGGMSAKAAKDCIWYEGEC